MLCANEERGEYWRSLSFCARHRAAIHRRGGRGRSCSVTGFCTRTDHSHVKPLNITFGGVWVKLLFKSHPETRSGEPLKNVPLIVLV
ncbi:unnamed protein product [Gadus morhua 'NCC']